MTETPQRIGSPYGWRTTLPSTPRPSTAISARAAKQGSLRPPVLSRREQERVVAWLAADTLSVLLAPSQESE